jgi:hypothetical protein
MKLTIAIALSAALLGCKKDSKDDSAAAGAGHDQSSDQGPIDITDPETCVRCHPTIAAEITESMHARAHHSRDPIYAGVRAIRMKKEGAEIAKACARCHTPGFEESPDDPNAVVGVTCVHCHNTVPAAPDGVLLGANDLAAGLTPAHGTGVAAPQLTDGRSVCLSCHAAMQSPKGVAMCTTGSEHAELIGDGDATCTSCHMPRVTGPATVGGTRIDHASHAFRGPHRAWYQDDPSFLASGVDLSATLDDSGLHVTLINGSGHALPTGFPGRQLIIGCRGLDADGAEIWQCPPRVLGKRYVDADGKPVLAPFSVKLESDTRVTGERATHDFAAPAEVATAEVTLSMRLLPPPLADKIGLADAPEGQPKQFATARAAR